LFIFSTRIDLSKFFSRVKDCASQKKKRGLAAHEEGMSRTGKGIDHRQQERGEEVPYLDQPDALQKKSSVPPEKKSRPMAARGKVRDLKGDQISAPQKRGYHIAAKRKGKRDSRKDLLNVREGCGQEHFSLAHRGDSHSKESFA